MFEVLKCFFLGPFELGDEVSVFFEGGKGGEKGLLGGLRRSFWKVLEGCGRGSGVH